MSVSPLRSQPLGRRYHSDRWPPLPLRPPPTSCADGWLRLGSAEAPRLSLEEEALQVPRGETAATTAMAARRQRSRRQKVCSFAAAPPAVEGGRSLESMRRQRLRAPASTAMEEDPPPPGADAAPKKQRPERRRGKPHDEPALPALQHHQLHQALSRPAARRPPAAQLETEVPLAMHATPCHPAVVRTASGPVRSASAQRSLRAPFKSSHRALSVGWDTFL